MRVGRAIGSAALVADGVHARADGLTSLGVVAGAVGVLAGFPRSDAIVGLIITAAIGYTLVVAARTVLRRVLDGIDVPTMRLIEAAAAAVPGVEHVSEARARWVGHQLRAELAIDVSPVISVEAGHDIAEQRASGAPATRSPAGRRHGPRGPARARCPTSEADAGHPHTGFAPYHGRSHGRDHPPTARLRRACPSTATGIRTWRRACTAPRCGRPICPECMIPAPVGHQCPECVNEARREFRKGPGRRIAAANIRRRASATTVLLAMIGAVFLLEVVTGGSGSLMTGPSGLKLINLGASIGLAQLPNGDVVGIATGQYWRLVSVDVPARRTPAHRVQRVRALDLRHDRRARARPSPVPADLLRHGHRRERRLVRVRAAFRRRRRRLGRHLRDLRGVRRVQLPATAPRDRRGSAQERRHDRRDQHGPRLLDPGDRLARPRRRLHRGAVRGVRGRRCRHPREQTDHPCRGLPRPARGRDRHWSPGGRRTCTRSSDRSDRRAYFLAGSAMP